jgi:NAD(P)H dehydrogenase (quinone)
MNKILVLFDSRSGHTARMAALVAEGAKSIADTEVRLRSVDEATADDVVWCDGLAVGSPTNMGLLSWKMKRFWDETMMPQWAKVDGKIACAFSSSGGWGGGSELACQSLLTVLMNFGFLVFGVTDYVSRDLTLHYGAIAAKEPRDEETHAACRKLGRRSSIGSSGTSPPSHYRIDEPSMKHLLTLMTALLLIAWQPQEDFCLGHDIGKPVTAYTGNSPFKVRINNLKITTP